MKLVLVDDKNRVVKSWQLGRRAGEVDLETVDDADFVGEIAVEYRQSIERHKWTPLQKLHGRINDLETGRRQRFMDSESRSFAKRWWGRIKNLGKAVD